MLDINFNIESLIPHRNSMKLLDKIVEIDDSHCITSATVSPDWPLVENGYASSIILIELAAQTAGVSFGWHEYRKGEKTRSGLGWLVGVKSAEFSREKIPLQARIVTMIEERKSDEVYAEITATARLGNETIAEMVLQVFRSANEERGEEI